VCSEEMFHECFAERGARVVGFCECFVRERGKLFSREREKCL